MASVVCTCDPRGSVSAWPNPRGFVGGTTEATGLVHLGACMYDPGAGRLTSDDPVTDTDSPQQLNGYAYAYNSPLTSSDPTGLIACIRIEDAAGLCASALHVDFDDREGPARSGRRRRCSHRFPGGAPAGPGQ